MMHFPNPEAFSDIFRTTIVAQCILIGETTTSVGTLRKSYLTDHDLESWSEKVLQLILKSGVAHSPLSCSAELQEMLCTSAQQLN